MGAERSLGELAAFFGTSWRRPAALISRRAEGISRGRTVVTRRFGLGKDWTGPSPTRIGFANLRRQGSMSSPSLARIMLRSCSIAFFTKIKVKKPFRFFEAWAHLPECRDIVRSVWLPTGTGSGGGPLTTKTVKVGKMLHHWQAKHWRATQNSIKDK